jgi:aspartate 1-decarboxylase
MTALVTMLKAKLHRVTVTAADLNYEGSITIGRDLLVEAGLLAYEQVDIYNCNNGARFTTYIIEGDAGCIQVNGAGARLVQVGDKLIIAAFTHVPEAVAAQHRPVKVFVDERNRALQSPLSLAAE